MVAVLSLLALVALGILFDRLWKEDRGLRREARVAGPVLEGAPVPAEPPEVSDDSAFRDELDRVMRILETGAGPARPVVQVDTAEPVVLQPAMRVDTPAKAAAKAPEPTVSEILTTLSALPEEVPVFDDFDATRDVLVIESENVDARISLRIEGAGAETVLMVDGIDRARVRPANGTFDAAAVRLVAA